MPAKRRTSDLLEAYHRGKGNFSREDGWRQFLENASRPALLSVLSALLATLPDPRRKDLEHYLAISEPALRDLVAPWSAPQSSAQVGSLG